MWEAVFKGPLQLVSTRISVAAGILCPRITEVAPLVGPYGSILANIVAAPGCGKTHLLLEFCDVFRVAFPEEMHFLALPTRKLRDKVVKQAMRMLGAEVVIPVGQDNQQNDILSCHIQALAEKAWTLQS
jgi:hypothetical protein